MRGRAKRAVRACNRVDAPFGAVCAERARLCARRVALGGEVGRVAEVARHAKTGHGEQN